MIKPDPKADKGEEAGSAGPSVAPGPGSSTDPFGMAAWLTDMTKMPLNPLMQNPAAVFAAATVIGIGVSNHIAGVMLGAMKGMAGPARETEAADVQAETPTARPAAKAEPVKKVTPATKAPVKARTPKPQKTVASAVDTAADDLKRISGIGPKLQQVLNGMGVRHYADVASWTEADVQRFDDELGVSGRIARDGWVEQAKALVRG